jgi:hypothetical protein
VDRQPQIAVWFAVTFLRKKSDLNSLLAAACQSRVANGPRATNLTNTLKLMRNKRRNHRSRPRAASASFFTVLPDSEVQAITDGWFQTVLSLSFFRTPGEKPFLPG